MEGSHKEQMETPGTEITGVAGISSEGRGGYGPLTPSFQDSGRL